MTTTYGGGISGPIWDRHKIVAGLNRLAGTNPSDNWIANDNTDINKQ
jgi:hypothetical protein